MPLSVTSLYAALLAILYLALTTRIGMLRGATRVPLGDGGRPELLVAIRCHANFAEWVPLALILIALVEINGAGRLWLHALGSVLLVARLAHPFGLETERLFTVPRIIGAAGTLFAIAGATLTLLWQYIQMPA